MEKKIAPHGVSHGKREKYERRNSEPGVSAFGRSKSGRKLREKSFFLRYTRKKSIFHM